MDLTLVLGFKPFRLRFSKSKQLAYIMEKSVILYSTVLVFISPTGPGPRKKPSHCLGVVKSDYV